MIGAYIEQLRTERALTQEALAAQAGISPSTLCRVEQGQTTPHFSTLRKLAAALVVDVRTLTEQLKKGPGAEPVNTIAPRFEVLTRLSKDESPVAALRGRRVLRGLAEDVVAAMVEDSSVSHRRIEMFARAAQEYEASLGPEGLALATYLGALCAALASPAGHEERGSVEAVRSLLSTVRTRPGADDQEVWRPIYDVASRQYAELLVCGGALPFHHGTSVFLLREAQLRMEDLAEGRDVGATGGRKALTALGTILSTFDFASLDAHRAQFGEDALLSQDVSPSEEDELPLEAWLASAATVSQLIPAGAGGY